MNLFFPQSEHDPSALQQLKTGFYELLQLDPEVSIGMPCLVLNDVLK